MSSFNQVCLMGNLTRDVELSYTSTGVPVGKFGMAVNEHYTAKDGTKKESVVFIDITVWNKQAETCTEYLHKGDVAMVVGKLKQDNWADKETGAKRSKLLVVANQVIFIKTKGQPGSKAPAPVAESPAQPENENDEEIPF